MSKTFAACLGDVQDLALRTLLGNRNFSNGAVAIGGTKSKVKLAAAVDYTIDGVFYTKGITDDLFVHTDLTVQAVGTTKYYALCLDSAGAGSIIAGPVNANVDGNVYPLGTTKVAPVPATLCCVGVLKITTDATHTFTPATTLNDAAGITAAYYNVSVIPAAGFPA